MHSASKATAALPVLNSLRLRILCKVVVSLLLHSAAAVLSRMSCRAHSAAQVLTGLADGPTVCYLRLHYFSSEGTRAFIDALSMSEYWGVEGYIIDLRNNPGEACIKMLLLAHCCITLIMPVHTTCLAYAKLHPKGNKPCNL